MKFQRCVLACALTALGSCGPTSQPQEAVNNSTAPVLPAPSAPPAGENSAPPEPGTPGGLPDDRAPLQEPKGRIDPKSAEAAGQVVQHYAALIEQKRFVEAEKLWGDAGTAKRTTTQLKTYSEAHLQIGKPTDEEGAAGSIFITVPIVLYGKNSDGAAFHDAGNVILRRVNDVPGSTEAQRRWHIERIEWKAA